MKTAIINNNGIGNGIIIYPIIKKLDLEQFIHIDNLFLKEKNGSLENIVGFFPKQWRRFQYIDKMLNYLDKKGVGKIINVRKEELNYDQNYFYFKDIAKKYFDVFDLYHENIDNLSPIGIQCEKVFENAFGKIDDVNWKWLNCELNKENDILFYVGSSIPKKVLSLDQIIKTHEGIREVAPDSKILICSGNQDYEKKYIEKISKIITNKNTKLYNFSKLQEAEEHVKRSYIILTVDTYISHLAGATNNETYTIFLRTNGLIWRNTTQPLTNIFQSEIPLNCNNMKEDGTCKYFYDGCSNCNGRDLNFERIGHIVGSRIFERYN